MKARNFSVDDSGVLSALVLAVGACLWLGTHFHLVVEGSGDRALPVEADDAYNYILHASEMESCFFYDCPALEDLRAQLLGLEASEGSAALKHRFHAVVFLHYHPLFSLLLLVLHKLGLAWGAAYSLLQHAAPALFCVGIAYFLTALWGRAQAGIALGLLAFHVFQGKGFHLVAPTNLTLGIAFLAWGRIINRRGDSPWILSLGTLILVCMHPIGRLYSGLGVLLAFFLLARPLKERIRPLLPASGLILLAFALPYLVTRLDLRVMHDPLGTGFTVWEIFSANFARVLDVGIRRYADVSGGIFIFPLMALGFLTVESVRRKPIAVFGMLIGLLLLASHFVSFSHKTALLATRVWVPAAVFLTGAIGQLAVALFRLDETLNVLTQKRRRVPGIISAAFTNPHTARRIGFGSALLLLSILLVFAVTNGREGIANVIGRQQRRYALALSRSQPAALLARARTNDQVLYVDRERDLLLLPFYLTEGAMDLGAVCYPLLKDSRRRDEWFGSRRLKYAVVYKTPLHVFWNQRNEISGIALDEILLLPREEMDLRELRLGLRNSGAALEAEIFPTDKGGEPIGEVPVIANIPGEWAGYLSTESGSLPERVDGILVRIPGAGDRLSITGTQISSSRLQWPWEEKAKLCINCGAKDGLMIEFDPQILLPSEVDQKEVVEVIDDSGGSVLLELGPRQGDGDEFSGG
jgi:hypothetical protein